MTADQKRIAHVAQFMDGIGDIDFHEAAEKYHSERCGCFRGPAGPDYYRAVAKAIDALRATPNGNEMQK